MDASAPSALAWERAAELQPRLPAEVSIHRHCYRGVPWFVVQDEPSGRHLRLDEGAWRIAGLMDGQRTLKDIQSALAAELEETAPSQDDILRVLLNLHAAEMLDCAALASVQQLDARRKQDSRARLRRLFGSPFSQRFALFDPQRLLDRLLPSVRGFVGPVGLLLWLLAVVWGLVLAFVNWAPISAGLTAEVLSPNNLLLLVLAYLFVKVIHEFGHAFVARAYGAQVHEIGVMLLVFMPVPYVDASAASAFPEKTRRMAVGAAGIMVELFLAVVALAAWLALEPGLLRDFAFNVMIVGGVSTVLINGNPLLRFDGYYVLCDAIEIPNLGSRSTRYLGYLVQRYLCGAEAAVSPVTAPGERAWLFWYGIAASVYRVGILVAIILFVAEAYPVVGVVLAVWGVVSQLLLPSIRGLRGLLTAPALAGRERHAALVLGIPAAVLLVLACVVPLPSWTYAEGVVWLPEGAQVRAGVDGVVAQQITGRGSNVQAGEPLFALDAEAVRAQVKILEQRLEEHQARYDAALFHDRVSIDMLEQKVVRARAELDDARERVAELLVRSPRAGMLRVPEQRRLHGRHVRKGELLGYITDDRPMTARVVVRQDEIDLVREDTIAVLAKLPGHPGRTLTGQIEGAVPSATNHLPSAALGAAGGGRISVETSDPDGRTAAESVFIVDVALPAEAPDWPVGARVLLRFEHASVPLAGQMVRAARQMLLSRFGV